MSEVPARWVGVGVRFGRAAPASGPAAPGAWGGGWGACGERSEGVSEGAPLRLLPALGV